MYAEDTDACAEGAENGCSPCYLNCSTGDCIGGMAGEGQGLFVAPLHSCKGLYDLVRQG